MIKLTHSTQEPSKEKIEKARASVDALFARTDLGFLKLPDREEVWTATERHADSVRRKYKKLIVLGIGGSSLGGMTFRESLGLKEIEFYENVDAYDFWDNLNSLKNISEAHWVIISKSGKTVETLTQANFIYENLREKGFSLARSATVITEKKSNPLNAWAAHNNIPLLEVPEDVGGRFSVLSPVGLFPAAFAKVDLQKVRKGAAAALENRDLAVQLTAHYLESFKNEKWISIFWAYSNRLRSYGLWTEQLWAESLGKKMSRKNSAAPRASTPISLVGATDQHSVLQQISEGAQDKFVTFLRVLESENTGPKLQSNLFEGENMVVGKNMGQLLAAEATATRNALEKAGVPSLSLEIEKLDAANLGALFMTMEIVVGAIGEAHDINAFDQPGVELGKRLAKEILLK